MHSIQLFTPDDTGWSSRQLTMQSIPSIGHWVHLSDHHYRVTAVVHTGWAVEVYAIVDDFTKVLDKA